MKVLPISHAARVQPHLFALQDAGVDIERKLGLKAFRVQFEAYPAARR